MLYVIEYCYLNCFEDDSSGITRVLKVGYTGNFDLRYSQYCICRDKNLKVLFKIEGGTLKDEQTLHRYLRKNFHQIPALGREWYEKSDDILEFFHKNTTIDDIRSITRRCTDLQISNLFFNSILEVISIDDNVGITPKRLTRSTKSILETEKSIKELKDRLIYFYGEDKFKMIFDIYNNRVALYKLNKKEIDKFIKEYSNKNSPRNRLKFLCEMNPPSDGIMEVILNLISASYKEFYLTLGPKRCRAHSYDITKVSRELSIKLFESKELEEVIYQRFIVGSRYSLSEVKKTLKDIYAEFGFQKTAKANDIEGFFNAKYVYTTDEETGKRIVNYELLSRLD